MSDDDDQENYSYAGEEYEISFTELMELSPHQALRSFFERHDELIEEITEDSGEQKACADGCGYCCHLKVIADAVEIFAMVDYVTEHLDKNEIDQIVQAAKQNIETAKNLTHKQQATINQQCPLLQNNHCLVYPMRSIKCRNYHATDLSSCRASFDNPKDLSILNQNITELYVAATGSTNGFMAALHQHGYDDRIYDHNAAFIEALNDPKCRQRYDARKRAFKTARYNNE